MAAQGDSIVLRRTTVLLGISLIVSAAAMADGALATTTVSGSLSVSMTIQAECQLQSTSNSLSFGTFGVINANVDAQTTLGVQCTNSTPYNLGLNAGGGTGATVASRLMTGTGTGSPTVTYAVYKDSNRSQVWGATTGVDAQASSGTGAMQTFTVYGRVPVQTTPAPGAYTDSMTLTVTY